MKRYRLKEGCGSHYTRDGRRLEAGDYIEVNGDWELGSAIDKFEEVVSRRRSKAPEPVKAKVAEPEPDKEPEPEDKQDEAELQMVHHGGGRYNVVNSVTDEIINDGWLTKEEAEALVNG